jgi:hypothetical protein
MLGTRLDALPPWGNARWRVEGMPDDRDSWGKTIARSRGLAMREESRNGVAEQWLASGE